MKVHVNAPLGPKGRLTMVLRVLEQRWSLTEAAEAAAAGTYTLGATRAGFDADVSDGFQVVDVVGRRGAASLNPSKRPPAPASPGSA